MLGDGHGRFGGRVRETDQVKARHRALARSYEALHRPEAEREAALAAEMENKAAFPPPPEITP